MGQRATNKFGSHSSIMRWISWHVGGLANVYSDLDLDLDLGILLSQSIFRYRSRSSLQVRDLCSFNTLLLLLLLLLLLGIGDGDVNSRRAPQAMAFSMGVLGVRPLWTFGDRPPQGYGIRSILEG